MMIRELSHAACGNSLETNCHAMRRFDGCRRRDINISIIHGRVVGTYLGEHC